MIRITNEIIQIGLKSYPTKNISSFEKTQKGEMRREEDQWKTRWSALKDLMIPYIVVSVVLLLMLTALKYTPENYALAVSFVFLPVFLVWVVLTSMFIVTIRTTMEREVSIYAVRLSVSGETIDIWTNDEGFRDRIYDAVEKAITHSARVNYTVNVEKQEIVNNNQTHIDQSTTNNYDYSINFNRYEGLSEAQLRFLSTEFNDALSRLAQDLRHEGDDELRQQLDELVATLKASSEHAKDAGRLKKSWARFKGLCEVYDLSQSALGLVGTIGKGVDIVTGLVT